MKGNEEPRGAELRFKTANGFTVCLNCGATYSGVLPSCPGCGEEPSEVKRPAIQRRYLCDAGYLCQMGGPDGVCCISCRGYHACTQPCHTAQIWMKLRDELNEAKEDEDNRPILYGKILCEHLTKEDS